MLCFHLLVLCTAMERDEIKKIYSRYSSVYDHLFAKTFFPRVKTGIEGIGIKKGDKILEVGVGTGISLPVYPPACKVTGIDLTRKMLEQANKKRNCFQLRHVDLFEMDAENLAFKNDTFDHAVIPFVISVVPDPVRMMSEVQRVTKQNGKIVVVNHFTNKKAILGKVERALTPMFTRLGWKSGLTLDLLSNHCNLSIDEVIKKHVLDLWWVVYITNNKQD